MLALSAEESAALNGLQQIRFRGEFLLTSHQVNSNACVD
jgi:hypothetical protein